MQLTSEIKLFNKLDSLRDTNASDGPITIFYLQCRILVTSVVSI